MAYPNKNIKKGYSTRKFTPEDKRKARLGASGNLSLIVSGGGTALAKGARIIKGLLKKKLTNKMKKPKMKRPKKGSKICPAGIAWAKRTFDKYPSAYANMAASKYCKDPNYAKNSKKK